MTNYVRANFCLEKLLEVQQLKLLIQQLASLNFVLASPSAQQSTQYEQKARELLVLPSAPLEFHWHINNQVISGRMSLFGDIDHGVDFYLDIEQVAFFNDRPKPTIEFTLTSDDNVLLFDAYKNIVIEVIRHIKPVAGFIDFEMDTVCYRMRSNEALASWGNYITNSLVHNQVEKFISEVAMLSDETLRIDDLGILVFIFPLAANQAWTSRHVALEQQLSQTSIRAALNQSRA